MNFVYYSKETYQTAYVKNKINYVYKDIDIRDFISEKVFKSAKDVILSSSGGALRLKLHDDIPSNRDYQVITSYTDNITSDYLLICPVSMTWGFSDITSEGVLAEGEKYIEINDEDICEADIMDLAYNLSYMYGLRFTPHTVEEGILYRITLDDKKNVNNIWKDITGNVKALKKLYKFLNISVCTNKRKRKINQERLTEDDFENVKF